MAHCELTDCPQNKLWNPSWDAGIKTTDWKYGWTMRAEATWKVIFAAIFMQLLSPWLTGTLQRGMRSSVFMDWVQNTRIGKRGNSRIDSECNWAIVLLRLSPVIFQKMVITLSILTHRSAGVLQFGKLRDYKHFRITTFSKEIVPSNFIKLEMLCRRYLPSRLHQL